jgi:ElaB/YqjD/DUF883 family membrane-anchored ribosome-binding protein
MDETLSPPLQALLALFESELKSVKFPEVDGAVLAQAAQRARDGAEAVTRAEAALEVARGALAQAQESLLQKAHRAQAYARVFAEERPELAQRLEAIVLPRPRLRATDSATPPAPRRRGRPPKGESNASLFESAPELTVETLEQVG